MNSITLENMFVANTAVKPAPPQFTASYDAPKQSDNVSQTIISDRKTAISDRKTADNAPLDNQREIVDQKTSAEQPESFDQTIRKKIQAEAPRKPQTDNKAKKQQDPNPKTSPETQPDQSLTADGVISAAAAASAALNAEGDISLLRKTTVETAGKPGELISKSKALNEFAAIAQNVKSAGEKGENVGQMQENGKELLQKVTILDDNRTNTVVIGEKKAVIGEQIIPDTKEMPMTHETAPVPKIAINQDNNSDIPLKTLKDGIETTIESAIAGKPQISKNLNTTEVNQKNANSEIIDTQPQQKNDGREISGKLENYAKNTDNNQESTIDDKPALSAQSSDFKQGMLINREDSKESAEQPKDSNANIAKIINREDSRQSTKQPKDSNAHIAKIDPSGQAKTSGFEQKAETKLDNQTADPAVQERSFAPKAESSNSILPNNSADSADLTAAAPVGENIQITAPSQSSPAVFAKAVDSFDPSQTIRQQIQESIQGSLRQGDKQIVIHLNPPELGKVVIKFQEVGNNIIGLLEVSKAQTRYQIQQELPQIVQNLQNAGVQIKQVEVVLTNQHEQQSFKEQSMAFAQQGGADQQNLSHQDAQQDNQELVTNDQLLTGANIYQSGSALREGFVTDSSINMLV